MLELYNIVGIGVKGEILKDIGRSFIPWAFL